MSKKKPKFEREDDDLVLSRPRTSHAASTLVKPGDVVITPDGESGTVHYLSGDMAFVIVPSGHIRQVRVFELTPHQDELA